MYYIMDNTKNQINTATGSAIKADVVEMLENMVNLLRNKGYTTCNLLNADGSVVEDSIMVLHYMEGDTLTNTETYSVIKHYSITEIDTFIVVEHFDNTEKYVRVGVTDTYNGDILHKEDTAVYRALYLDQVLDGYKTKYPKWGVVHR